MREIPHKTVRFAAWFGLWTLCVITGSVPRKSPMNTNTAQSVRGSHCFLQRSGQPSAAQNPPARATNFPPVRTVSSVPPPIGVQQLYFRTASHVFAEVFPTDEKRSPERSENGRGVWRFSPSSCRAIRARDAAQNEGLARELVPVSF